MPRLLLLFRVKQTSSSATSLTNPAFTDIDVGESMEPEGVIAFEKGVIDLVWGRWNMTTGP
jgi:hypothetical protein